MSDVEQSVELHLGAPRFPDEWSLRQVTEAVEEVLDDREVGVWVGDEPSLSEEGGTVVFFSGPDADRLFLAVREGLADAPVPAESYALKRYDDPVRSDERVDLDASE